jgi:hypothetical protein
MGAKVQGATIMDLLDVPFGVRYVGCWEQQPVRSTKQVLEFIKEHNGIDNVGISMCVYKHGVPHLLFLPFDFDSEKDIRLAWLDAKELYNKFVDKGYRTIITYSGKKGFHVYLKVKPKFYPRKQIAFVQESYKKHYALKTMDEQLFGDIRRLMRVPYTLNMKGEYCKVLSQTEGKELDLDDIINPINIKSKFDKPYSIPEELEPREYPCLEKLICDRKFWIKYHPRHKYEPAQLVRYSWVAMKLLNGEEPEDILAEASSFGWDDWDEEETAKQIDQIAGRGDYYPLSCASLRSMGWCVVSDCKFNYKDRSVLKEVGIE